MEALRLPWRDVDFETQLLHIGRDGQTKNREPRTVDFNPDLAAHLRDMHTRKAPDSPWLFPSPKRADREVHEHWQNPHKVWYKSRAGDSRVFLMLNFTISATSLRVAA